MKVPILNLAELSKEFRDAVRQGIPRKEMLVFRFHNGKARLMIVNIFVQRWGNMYPELCKELEKRKEMLAEREILYVWAYGNGEYDMGVLEQRTPLIFSHSS